MLAHCDKYDVELGRICDNPATVCQGRRYRCDKHDPYRIHTPIEVDLQTELTAARAEIETLKADREILFHAMGCPFDHCERCIADADRVREICAAIDAARAAEEK